MRFGPFNFGNFARRTPSTPRIAQNRQKRATRRQRNRVTRQNRGNVSRSRLPSRRGGTQSPPIIPQTTLPRF